MADIVLEKPQLLLTSLSLMQSALCIQKKGNLKQQHSQEVSQLLAEYSWWHMFNLATSENNTFFVLFLLKSHK